MIFNNLKSAVTRLSLLLPFAALLIAILAVSSQSQSSLFNVPTTDVLGEGEAYVEADVDAHFARYRNGGWNSYGFSGIYGIARNAEVGVNAYVTRSADGLSPVEIQPNFKYRLYNNEEKGISVAAGAIAYLPLSGKFRDSAFGSVYAVASKKFRGAYAPRFSGGGYQFVAARADSGSKRGFLAAVEQPVHSRVTLIADWNSGKNRLGYSAAGVGITLTKRSYLYSAYYFGNQGRGNNSLGIYYGFSF